ncbi:MAG: pirin family protein [Nannocystaceae bacterium]|nr:pirin family protein [Nannocystaceae bacterium]
MDTPAAGATTPTPPTSGDAALGSPRDAVSLTRGVPASDGAGVRLLRVLGTQVLPLVDPFLMLDEFRSDDAKDYIAGFPDHPHRGFETVTIMLAGRMQHRDSVGNTGDLGPGSVQWMTAGRGIIHSEMPKQQDGLMWGFQLWVNLPAKDKMTAPRYQDIEADAIPTVTRAGDVEVRVIAGTVDGVRGPIDAAATEPVLLDVRLPASSRFDHRLPTGHNGFVYAYEGDVVVAGTSSDRVVPRGHIAVLGPGDGLRLRADGAAAKALVVCGRPIGEPVARYGPFVMNTNAELEQAFRDYRSGKLGR